MLFGMATPQYPTLIYDNDDEKDEELCDDDEDVLFVCVFCYFVD